MNRITTYHRPFKDEEGGDCPRLSAGMARMKVVITKRGSSWLPFRSSTRELETALEAQRLAAQVSCLFVLPCKAFLKGNEVRSSLVQNQGTYNREWRVQRIIREAHAADGTLFYKIRWADQGSTKWSQPVHDWWLPSSECRKCMGCVRAFLKEKKKMMTSA